MQSLIIKDPPTYPPTTSRRTNQLLSAGDSQAAPIQTQVLQLGGGLEEREEQRAGEVGGVWHQEWLQPPGGYMSNKPGRIINRSKIQFEFCSWNLRQESDRWPSLLALRVWSNQDGSEGGEPRLWKRPFSGANNFWLFGWKAKYCRIMWWSINMHWML